MNCRNSKKILSQKVIFENFLRIRENNSSEKCGVFGSTSKETAEERQVSLVGAPTLKHL